MVRLEVVNLYRLDEANGLESKKLVAWSRRILSCSSVYGKLVQNLRMLGLELFCRFVFVKESTAEELSEGGVVVVSADRLSLWFRHLYFKGCIGQWILCGSLFS